ncbi:hypothetical protein TNCV_2243701 [Trichonephila clavipes]|nr:hypothetical protein TNCV_2243701 [Trichonephila clavipes]
MAKFITGLFIYIQFKQKKNEKFARLCVLDSFVDELLAICRRMEHWENSECNPELMRSIDEVVRRVNPFVAT